MDGFSTFFQRSTRVLPFAFLPLLVSCGVAGLSSSQKIDETANVPTVNASTLPPVGTTASTAAGFTIQVTNTNMTTYLHKTSTAYGSTQPTTGFSTACQIPYGTSGASADTLCMLEVEELDLYFNDLTLQVNVPAGMCTYVGQAGYDFFDYQPGVGPTTMSYSKDYTGTIYPGTGVDSSGVPHCTYNYGDTYYHGGTNVFNGNCCIGTYAFTVSTQATSTSSFVTTTTTASWGGKTGNCLTGPAVTGAAAQTLTADEAVPEEMLTYVATSGLNVNYTIPKANQQSINGTALTSDVWAANYYDPANFTAVDSATSLKKPAGLTTFNNYTPQDTYTWTCYDTAQEIQSRIRLFIRKWNTASITEGGSAETTGTSTTYPSDPLDDHYSWKDMATLMAGAEYPGADL